MVKGNIKDKKAAKLAAQKLSDVKLYRLMIQFVLAIIALFLTISAENNQIFVIFEVMPIVLAVAGVLFGLSALLYCIKRAKGKDETLKLFTSVGIFGNAAALLFLASLYYLFASAELVIAALIALTVTYIAYNVEGESFFAYTVITAASYVSLCIASENAFYSFGNIIRAGAQVMTLVIPVAAIVLSIILFAKKNGVTVLSVNIKGKKIAAAMLVTALAALASTLLTVILAPAAIIATYVMIAIYFIVTVIGIFRMM